MDQARITRYSPILLRKLPVQHKLTLTFNTPGMLIQSLPRLLTHPIVQVPYIQAQRDMTRNNITGGTLYVDLPNRRNQSHLITSQRLNGKDELCCTTQGIFTQRHRYCPCMPQFSREA